MPLLHVREGIFDQMAKAIHLRINAALMFAMATRRDLRLHALPFGLCHGLVAIVTPVSQ